MVAKFTICAQIINASYMIHRYLKNTKYEQYTHTRYDDIITIQVIDRKLLDDQDCVDYLTNINSYISEYVLTNEIRKPFKSEYMTYLNMFFNILPTYDHNISIIITSYII